MKEITFELTNFCPHDCKFCSSNSVKDKGTAQYITYGTVEIFLDTNGPFDRIILSGGEPLAHRDFYNILQLCKKHSKDIIVYSNAINHLVFNPHVIDGVYLEANLTLNENVERVRILKRIDQGREKERPEVKFSRNWDEDCSCESHVMLPSGQIVKSPCNKIPEEDHD